MTTITSPESAQPPPHTFTSQDSARLTTAQPDVLSGATAPPGPAVLPVAAGLPCVSTGDAGDNGDDVSPSFSDEGATANPALPEVKRKSSQATLLAELAVAAEIELFHTPEGQAYVTFAVGTSPDRHFETHAVRSRVFRQWLYHRYYKATGGTPSGQAVTDALATLEGRARFDGPERPVAVRLAGQALEWQLDLGDRSWRQVHLFDQLGMYAEQGWLIRPGQDPPAVRSCRPGGLLPLPSPERGGSIQDLRRFVNVASDQDFMLLVSWLVAALRPTGPYPVLVLLGEQGSAKSTTARVLRALIDPNKAPLRAEPRDARDLIIAASNSWVVALDNVSHLPAWLSDALCRLATGGGFSTRELYTDQSEIIFDAMRPVLLNGIDEFVTRPDLLDRAIVVTLPRIDEAQRRSERDFWLDFDWHAGRLLGALLDGVQLAHRTVGRVPLPSRPRMADFAEWAYAAAPAFGWTGDAFLRAYEGNRRDVNDLPLDASPFVPCLTALVARMGSFTGTVTELLQQLNTAAGDDAHRHKGWPVSAAALSNALQRLAPNLRLAGIDYERLGRGHGGRRLLRLSTTPAAAGGQATPTTRKGGQEVVTLVTPVTPESENAPRGDDPGDEGDAPGVSATTMSSPESGAGEPVGDEGDDGDDVSHAFAGAIAVLALPPLGRPVTRLSGPDLEPCPRCATPLTGSTCYPCDDRVCAGCGGWTGRVFLERCAVCDPDTAREAIT